MPIYDYRCGTCRHRFEVIHGVFAAGPETCPACGGGPVTKAVVASAVHFKGTGWAKKERHAASASKSRDSTAADPEVPSKPTAGEAPTAEKGKGLGQAGGGGDPSSTATGARTPAPQTSSGSATGTTGTD